MPLADKLRAMNEQLPDSPEQQAILMGQPGITPTIPATPEEVGVDPEVARTILEIGVSGALGSVGFTVARLVGFGKVAAQVGAVGAAGAGAGAARLATEGSTENVPEAALRGALGEGVGRAVSPLAARALAGPTALAERIPGIGNLVRRFTGASHRETLVPGAEDVLTFLNNKGATVTPGVLVERSMPQVLDNIARAGVFSGGIMRRTLGEAAEVSTREIQGGAAKALQEAAAATSKETAQATAAFTLKYGNSMARGLLVQDSLKNGATMFRRVAAQKYALVDEAARGAHIDIRHLKALAAEIASEAGRRGPNAAKQAETLVGEVFQKAKPTVTSKRGQRVLKGFKDVARDDFVSFQEAASLRSNLLERTRAIDKNIAGFSEAQAKRLVQELDNAFTASESTLSRDALNLKRGADRFWREGQDTFNSDFINTILDNASPEMIFRDIIKPGGVSNILRVQKALGGTQSPPMRAIQGEFLLDLMRKGAAETGEQLGDFPAQIAGQKLINQLNKTGDETLVALFGKGDTQTLKTAARALELAQLTSGGANRTGTVAIQLAQAGALLTLGGSVAAEATNTGSEELRRTGLGASMFILLGPTAVARMFTDKTMVRWLTVGLKSPPGTTTATRAVSHILARADQLGIMDEPLTQESLQSGRPRTPQEGREELLRRARRFMVLPEEEGITELEGPRAGQPLTGRQILQQRIQQKGGQ